MTEYEVVLLHSAEQDVAKLDRAIAERIFAKIAWMARNFDNLAPEAHSGELRGLFKLRVGNYRVVYSVASAERLIVIHAVSHRKDVYQ